MAGRPRVLWTKEFCEVDFALQLDHSFKEAMELLKGDPKPEYTISARGEVVQAIFTTLWEPSETEIAEAVALLAGYGVRVCEEAE